MRGVVALAAALALPQTRADGSPFPQRDTILFLTFCVIFATLVLQGLTLPVLIRRLGAGTRSRERREEVAARRAMIEAALRQLEQTPERHELHARDIYEDVARHYRLRLVALERADGGGRVFSHQHDLFEQVTRDLRKIERAAVVRLRDQDRISDEVLRSLLRELDLLDARPEATYPDDAASDL
jgi:CPA1 family monovalent cation:H+ antiporter